MEPKEEFLSLYREHITRPGSQELLDYLLHKSDFSPPPPPPGSTATTPEGCANTPSTSTTALPTI